MGGNAVDQTYDVKPGRKPADEYHRIMERTCWKLSNMFSWSMLAPVKAYANKESFGDGDIILERDELPANWISIIHKAFAPQNMVVNRFGGSPFSYKWDDSVPEVSPDCFSVSFDVQGLQVDLILVNRNEFHAARVYYAFNDLGNFMGRIAERMGFKYGWDGFWKEVRVEDEVVGKILVSRDTAKVFDFLGYDYNRFKQGFNTLEEVYEYAASTQYFSRLPFQLENRNHKSRARDAKRSSYRGFLEWMADKPELDKSAWHVYDPKNATDYDLYRRNTERNGFLVVAYSTFPGLEAEYKNIETVEIIKRQAKQHWNGKLVSETTGYSGEKLGRFMTYCKNSLPLKDTRWHSFEQWVVENGRWEVIDYIKNCMNDFEEDTDV